MTGLQVPTLTPRRAQQLAVSNSELLVAYYRCMSPEKQREFFQLKSSPAEKVIFLMRWGAWEHGIPMRMQ